MITVKVKGIFGEVEAGYDSPMRDNVKVLLGFVVESYEKLKVLEQESETNE